MYWIEFVYRQVLRNCLDLRVKQMFRYDGGSKFGKLHWFTGGKGLRLWDCGLCVCVSSGRGAEEVGCFVEWSVYQGISKQWPNGEFVSRMDVFNEIWIGALFEVCWFWFGLVHTCIGRGWRGNVCSKTSPRKVSISFRMWILKLYIFSAVKLLSFDLFYRYCVVFDPLDGSSNIDCGVSIGTVRYIYSSRFWFPTLNVDIGCKLYADIWNLHDERWRGTYSRRCTSAW